MSESLQFILMGIIVSAATLYLLQLWFFPKILALFSRGQNRLKAGGCSSCPSSKSSCQWSKISS